MTTLDDELTNTSM